MKIHATVKIWGSSLGIVLPKEIVKAEGLKPREEIIVEVVRKPDLRKVFGTLKLGKAVQELKDGIREGWKPEH